MEEVQEQVQEETQQINADYPASASTTMEISTDSEDMFTDNIFSIPDEYKEKSYLKGIDNYDEVFKMLDNSQSLIGKKQIGVLPPKENATQEELDNFYKEIGRPETPDNYEFEKIDLPDGLNRDEEFEKSIKQQMYDIGLTKKQAENLAKWYDTNMLEKTKKFKEQRDIDFDNLSNNIFGNDKDKVMNDAGKLIQDNIPNEFKDKLDSLDNNSLIIMAGILKNIQKKYINEDKMPNVSMTPQTNKGEFDIRAENRKIYADPAFRDERDRRHPELMKKLSENEVLLRKIYSSK